MLCVRHLLRWVVKVANAIPQLNKLLVLKALKPLLKHANSGPINKRAKRSTSVDKATIEAKLRRSLVKQLVPSVDIYVVGYHLPKLKCCRASLEHQVKGRQKRGY